MAVTVQQAFKVTVIEGVVNVSMLVRLDWQWMLNSGYLALL